MPEPIAMLGALAEAAIRTDLDFLIDGVSEIGAPGVPGPLCIYGTESFQVVSGAIRGVRAPVAATGRWKAGRVVALGHNGYFDRDTLESVDSGRLVANALKWAAGKGNARPRIGVSEVSELKDWLSEAGYDVAEVTLTPDSLETVDVVALAMWDESAREIDALSSYMSGGGGLVAAIPGWAWAQHNPDQDPISEFAGNRLLARFGIQWADDLLERTTSVGYTVNQSYDELMHAGNALDALAANATGGRILTETEIDQALDTLRLSSRCMSADVELFEPRLNTLFGATDQNRRWPSSEEPVGRSEEINRLAATLFVLDQSRTPPESVRAHPAALDFPGAVPSDAPRVTHGIDVDTSVPRWHSTGLYAAPGELVTVTVPAPVAKAGGFHVRVGAHTDGIWNRSEWTRMPEISRRFTISETETIVANAFGGLIYIEVPDNAGLGHISLEIQGAVEAPLFVLGVTDPVLWKEEIRNSPAPWAEIAGRNMIVAVPSSEVRNLDNPVAVAEAWDRVLDLNAELAAWPSTARRSPERFVVDRQISVGYMHSGYPLMAHLDQQANLVDARHLSSECNWGFYHEVGHNHQADDWTFDGTVEVTVNLFTLYAFEFLCGIPVGENENASAAFCAEQMARYDFDNPDFEQWKKEPFLALVMYVQLQQEFGWDAYRQVFAAYRELTDSERPKNDGEKRDQWMVRFSRQVGRNLGPFFEAWGVPTSQAALNAVSDLPAWLPPGFPPEQ